jgi:WD40-like Beta Propeller Repeat
MPAHCVRRAALATLALAAVACGDPGPVVRVSVVEPSAWGSDWDHTSNRVAINKRGADGDYHLLTMTPEGQDEQPFGAGNPAMPTRNAGSPAWHPSGKYVAFVAEKEEHPGSSAEATPGWGGYSDLWLATADGTSVWQLTNTPNDADHGTLIPLFSPDGTQLAWAERTQGPNLLDARMQFGAWVLKVASFVDDASGPHLEGVRDVTPGPAAFYETGGFTRDGAGLLFTSDYVTGSVWQSQIYRLDLASGAVTPLTTDGYNEHPRAKPGAGILWMCGAGATLGGTDWWTMNDDGTGKQRITFFNEPFDPTSSGKAVWVGPVPPENWSADGRWFLGDVETNLVTTDGEVRKVVLAPPGG